MIAKLNKRNSSTYKKTKKNFGHSYHYSELCSFHAQPTLTARLRCDWRYAVVRTIGRARFPRSVSLRVYRGVATAIVTVGNQARGKRRILYLGTRDHTCATVHGSRKFSRFTHWCRSCARGWSPVCWGPDAASTASVSRGKRGAVVAPHPGWRSAAAGSPALRASSRAGTRRAGITGASANSCLPGPGSARESAPALRRRLISLLKQFEMSGD